MSKYQRKRTIPRPTEKAEYKEENALAARSGVLQGQRYEVYQFIRDNPDCTRDDVGRGLGLRSSTATARIKELIDEGFIVEPPRVKKRNRSGVMAQVLRIATERKQGSFELDKVRVEVTLTIDCNGVYGATARVVDGLKQREPIVPISKHKLTLTAPHPDTYSSEFIDDDVAQVSRADTQAHAEDIIEADYTVIEDD